MHRADRDRVASWILRVIVASALVLLARAAGQAWFRSDDFALLLRVQGQPGEFDPLVSLWPAQERYWWAYRPLGTELYFALSHALFGIEAAGYHALTLMVHAANAWFLSVLAARLGLGPWAARFSGVAYLVWASLSLHLLRAATFHYQLATLCLLLSLLPIASAARDPAAPLSRRVLRYGLSIGWFAVGLLCNRSILLFLPAAWGLHWHVQPRSLHLWRRFSACFVRVSPQLLLALGVQWLDRRVWKPMPRHPYYGAFWDGDTPRRLVHLLAEGAGPWPGTWLALAVLLACGVLWASRGLSRRASGDRAESATMALALPWWLAAFGAASLFFYLPHVRFTFPAVAPTCLLLAASLERFIPAAQRASMVALLGALLFPMVPLWRLGERSIDAPLREALLLVRAVNPSLERPIVVEFGGPGQASPETLADYRHATFRFAHLRLIRPGAALRVRVVEAASGEAYPRDAIVLQLRPDMTLTPKALPP